MFPSLSLYQHIDNIKVYFCDEKNVGQLINCADFYLLLLMFEAVISARRIT